MQNDSHSHDNSQAGATALVQKLFIAQINAIRAHIFTLLPDFNLASDVLQEVFLVVTEKAATFEPGTNFNAWVRQITKRKVLETVRKQRASQFLDPELIETLCADMPEPSLDEPRHDALTTCLEKLSPRAFQLVTLRYREGRMPRQIAQQLILTVESVHASLSRARATLRLCVEKELVRQEAP